MKHPLIWGGAVACGVLVAQGWALQYGQKNNQTNMQQSSQGAAESKMSHPSVDARVANLLNTVNQGEIDEGQLMADHARNQAVKDYAKMLVSDHQKAQDGLKDVSSRANLTLGTNTALEQDSAKLKTRLSNAQGAAADREFLRAEVRDHAKVVRELRQLEPRITDPGLKSYVSQMMPALEAHMRQARSLMSGAAATGTPAGRAPGSRHSGIPPSGS